MTDIAEEEEGIITHLNGKLPNETPVLTTFLHTKLLLIRFYENMKTGEDRTAHCYGPSMLISSGFRERRRDIY